MSYKEAKPDGVWNWIAETSYIWIQFDFELLVKGRFPEIRGHTEQTNRIISRLLRRKNRVVFARDLVMEHLMAGYHNLFQI
jgi:hypothetical protein